MGRMGSSEINKPGTTDGRSQAIAGYVQLAIVAAFAANEVEIYSASPSHRRECTYYIAVGYYKLRNYSHARKFNGESHLHLHRLLSTTTMMTGMKLIVDLLLSVEPDNMQAQSLRTLIENSVQRDGYIGESESVWRLKLMVGMGLLAGAAAVTGLVVAGVLKRARR